MPEPLCSACGRPLTPGSTAFLCGPDCATQLPLPAYCASRECRDARDAAAIARAIERGIINP